MMRAYLLLSMAVVLTVAQWDSAADEALDEEDQWVRVPGGVWLHRDCIYSVPSGHVIDKIVSNE